MKDKIFLYTFYFILFILALFFIILIFSVLIQLNITSSIKGINSKEVFFAIRLTIISATVSSSLALIFSIPVAYILARHDFLFKNIIDAVLYLPIVISPIALGAMLLIFFNLPIGRFIENNLFRIVF